jgi:hypothetical protein
MKCEKCKTETSLNWGDDYQVHYGTGRVLHSERRGNTIYSTTEHEFSGRASSFICNKCVGARIAISRVGLSVLPIIWSLFCLWLWVSLRHNRPNFNFKEPSFYIFLLFFILGSIVALSCIWTAIIITKHIKNHHEDALKKLIQTRGDSKDCGDSIVRNLWKADLMKKGYNEFLTRKEYEEFSRRSIRTFKNWPRP